MVTKTITITEDAYRILKSWKQGSESFSETIRRKGKRRPLSDYYGILSKESGERFERAIMDMREKRNILHQEKRVKLKQAIKEHYHDLS